MERPHPPQSDGLTRRGLIPTAAGAVLAKPVAEARAAGAPVGVGYPRWTERRPTISLLDKPAADDGFAGAQLATSDNNTTGRFLGQQFALIDPPAREGDDPIDIFGKMVTEGAALLLTDVPMQQLLAAAGAAIPKGATLFNIAAPDDALRQESCRSNVINVAPSRAMLADALGQLVGTRPRVAQFKPDGSEVWVSSELGGVVSVIDAEKHVVTHKIAFAVQGLRGEGIQPVGISFTKDGATAFVALAPVGIVMGSQ
jgi:hypothetical protein